MMTTILSTTSWLTQTSLIWRITVMTRLSGSQVSSYINSIIMAEITLIFLLFKSRTFFWGINFTVRLKRFRF